VILIHGMAASLHDWDDLAPVLVREGYSAHALDLLGHGESPRPEARLYQIEWLFEQLSAWIDSLQLDQPAVLIGHSLGGYLALEAARHLPEKTRALILVDPFYRRDQLPALLRLSSRRPSLNMAVIERLPDWMLRMIIDATSLSMGHSQGGAHNLPEHVRAQTALDYRRTAAGVYHLPNTIEDLTPHLPEIHQPTLLIWGERDTTLAPASFRELAASLPRVTVHSLPAGHVPHQSHADEFNAMVLEFLRDL
jgi:pimeloyl-ACP methyl ester carboxylesterase